MFGIQMIVKINSHTAAAAVSEDLRNLVTTLLEDSHKSSVVHDVILSAVRIDLVQIIIVKENEKI